MNEPESRGEVTRLLVSWREGNILAADQLHALLYQQLRRLASSQLRRAPGTPTLNTTALVHETYIKLVGGSAVKVKDRSHFFALAARVMRQIIVDHARRRRSAKRGGLDRPITLQDHAEVETARIDDVLALDEALRRLEAIDPRLAKQVELRYFGGLSVEEVAEVLETSARTVKRDWQKARAFLFHALRR